jgi:hypothetical protein
MSPVISAITLDIFLDKFQQDHPEILISSPWFNPGHYWQVTIAGHGMTSYPPDGAGMRADLEARYPPPKPAE